jgi:serine protease Do
MNRSWQRTLGAGAGAAVLGAAMIWGGLFLSTSHAVTSPAQTAVATTPAAQPPGAGFTDVARAVTPAVVNITPSIAGKTADSREPH